VRLHILSDLHLEFAPFEMPAVDADALILAGDVALGTAGAHYAIEHADGRPVLYVAGNHEYYRHSFPDLNDEIRAVSDGTTVRFLENTELVIDGVRFLGCALWSDFTAGEASVEDATGRECDLPGWAGASRASTGSAGFVAPSSRGSGRRARWRSTRA
jgi:hypothetical protein